MESVKKPQANRGDLHELTAATFTVLTGFARSGPTGLGRVKVGDRRPVGNAPPSCGLRSGVLGGEGVSLVTDARPSPPVDDHGHHVESVLAGGLGSGGDPPARGTDEVRPLATVHRFGGMLRTRPPRLHFDEGDHVALAHDEIHLETAGAPVSRDHPATTGFQVRGRESFTASSERFHGRRLAVRIITPSRRRLGTQDSRVVQPSVASSAGPVKPAARTSASTSAAARNCG